MMLPKRSEFLPYSLPLFDGMEEAEVVKCIRSGWVSTGPRVRELEERFKEFLGVPHAIALSSCTAALHLSLVALGVGAGDEVITSPFTYAATANTVVHTGARPVFCDIEEDTFNIDPKKLAKLLDERYRLDKNHNGWVNKKNGRKLKGLVLVHYAGQVCDMNRLMHLVDQYGLKVVEDAAHAVGSSYQGTNAGLFGSTGCFSFYAIKNMATGEGGMVVTSSDELAEKVRVWSLHGMSKDAWKRYSDKGSWYYEVMVPGFKYNMSDLMASLGIHQLDKLEGFNERRRHLAKIYDEAFSGIERLQLHKVRGHVVTNRHIYPVLIESDRDRPNRDDFIKALAERNVGTSIHFIPLHLMPYYQKTFGYRRGDFPVAESVFDRIVSLPLYPKMSDQDAAYVVDSVTGILSGLFRR
jgi:dTDP-4-amino-4,6-dideoxygalactose transaminase